MIICYEVKLMRHMIAMDYKTFGRPNLVEKSIVSAASKVD